MKFSLIAASAALFAGAFAAPVAIEKRQVGQVVTVVQSLLGQVEQYTGAINSTLAGVQLPIANALKDEITQEVAQSLEGITNLLDSVLDQTKGLTDLSNVQSILRSVPVVGSIGLKRQVDTAAVSDLAAQLVAEVTATVGSLANVEGLGDLTNVITPLGQTIGTLLGDLENIVGDVLATVATILKSLGINVQVGLLGLNISL